jgi:hypothetical protein
MAIIDSRGAFHGSAGNLVFRTWKGKRIAQAKPRPYTQTKATKESGIDFGVASSSAKVIREAFGSLFKGNDSGMINRLNRSVLAAIRASRTAVRGQRDLHDGDAALLSGMEFNTHSPLAEVLGFKPEVSRNAQGQVVVNLPDFHSENDLRVPPAHRIDKYYLLRFQLIGFNYREGYYEYLGTQDVELPTATDIAARQLVFEEEVPEGCLLLLGMAFLSQRYNRASHQRECTNDGEFSPAALIAGFAAEEPGGGESNEERAEKKNTDTLTLVLPMGDYVGADLIRKYQAKLSGKRRHGQEEEPVIEPVKKLPDIPPTGKRVIIKK